MTKPAIAIFVYPHGDYRIKVDAKHVEIERGHFDVNWANKKFVYQRGIVKRQTYPVLRYRKWDYAVVEKMCRHFYDVYADTGIKSASPRSELAT